MAEAFRSGKHFLHLRQCLVLFSLIFWSSFLFAQSQQSSQGSLNGAVRDALGAPIANASLILQNKNSPTSLTTTTDARGRYSFTAISAGEFSLHATKKGYAEADVEALTIRSHEAATRDFVLQVDPITAPRFFDDPQFTVSGVTDTTSLGGHGSDTVVRARNSIAKDTTALSIADAEPSATAPDVDKSLRAGNYNQARDEVTRLLAHQDTAAVHHLLASIDEKLGDSLNAVHEYQHAAQMDPTEPYIFDWGSELLLHHAPEPAAEVFDKGTKIFPKSARMWIGLGAASFARGSNEQAIRQVCTASDLNPDDPAPYLFLGKMQRAEKLPSEEVLEKLHRFVTLQPQNPQANYYYAVGLWKSRDLQDKSRAAQVESLLANSIRLDSQFAEAELQLGIVYADQGDFSGAIPHYERVTQIDPQSEEAHFRLAQAYRQVDEPQKSKEELHRYQQLSKESSAELERERREIRQFVYTLRDQPHSR